MSSSLETKFSGDSSQLQAEYQKIARENVKLREEAKKTAEEHERGGEKANELAERMNEFISEQIRGLVEMGAEWLTVHKAVELVSEELERQNELRKKALEFQTEAGAARPQLYRNLAGLSREEMAEVKEQLELLQTRYSIPHEQTLDAAAVQAISATGGDTRKGLANLEQALRMVPDAAEHPDELESLAGGLGDLAKVTSEPDPEKNLGFLLSVQHGARVTALKDASVNLIPAALALKQHGASVQEAFAVLSSLGQSIEDSEGAETGTGAIKFSEKLDQFFAPEQIEQRVGRALAGEGGKEASGQKIDEALRSRVVAFAEGHGLQGAGRHAFKDLMHVLGEQGLMRGLVESETSRITSLAGEHEFGRQVEALRANEDLRKQFESEKGVFGRAKTIAALRGFVESGDSVMGQFYDAEKGALPSGAAAAAVARESIAQLHADAAVRHKAASQASDVFEEQSFTADNARARDAVYQKAFARLLDISNQGFGSSFSNWLGRGYFSLQMNLGARLQRPGAPHASRATSPHDMFVAEARDRIRSARYDEAISGGFRPLQFGKENEEEAIRAGHIRRTADPNRLATAKRIEELLERVVELAESDQHQAKDHHRENQTTARQNGARIQAAKPRGREP